jgi:hypothetical protein
MERKEPADHLEVSHSTCSVSTVLGGRCWFRVMSCLSPLMLRDTTNLIPRRPTPKAGPLGQPTDYAKKHWSGLISGYYVPRVRLYRHHALAAAAAATAVKQGGKYCCSENLQ